MFTCTTHANTLCWVGGSGSFGEFAGIANTTSPTYMVMGLANFNGIEQLTHGKEVPIVLLGVTHQKVHYEAHTESLQQRSHETLIDTKVVKGVRKVLLMLPSSNLLLFHNAIPNLWCHKSKVLLHFLRERPVHRHAPPRERGDGQVVLNWLGCILVPF